MIYVGIKPTIYIQMEHYNIVNYTVEHISTGVKKNSVIIRCQVQRHALSRTLFSNKPFTIFLHPPPPTLPISPFLSKSPSAKFNATSAGSMQLAALCVCSPQLHVCVIMFESFYCVFYKNMFTSGIWYALVKQWFIPFILTTFPSLRLQKSYDKIMPGKS